MPKCVVFSERAFISILVETQEKIKTETGGVFLGYRKGDIWYVIESIDPGPNSVFQTAYFEYDQAYINHLINMPRHLTISFRQSTNTVTSSGVLKIPNTKQIAMDTMF